jgi:hypothetical protein
VIFFHNQLISQRPTLRKLGMKSVTFICVYYFPLE